MYMYIYIDNVLSNLDFQAKPKCILIIVKLRNVFKRYKFQFHRYTFRIFLLVKTVILCVIYNFTILSATNTSLKTYFQENRFIDLIFRIFPPSPLDII